MIFDHNSHNWLLIGYCWLMIGYRWLIVSRHIKNIMMDNHLAMVQQWEVNGNIVLHQP